MAQDRDPADRGSADIAARPIGVPASRGECWGSDVREWEVWGCKGDVSAIRGNPAYGRRFDIMVPLLLVLLLAIVLSVSDSR